MSRRYWLCCAALCLLTTVVVISCSGKKSTDSTTEEPAQTIDTVLTWVGTDVVYQDLPGKHDHSIIFVLAEWCGWCQRFKRETLADSTVIHVLNESFNIVHLNPDADSMVVYRDSTVNCGDLAGSVYDVHSYPSMLFFDRDGDLTCVRRGYKPATDFLPILDSVRTGKL